MDKIEKALKKFSQRERGKIKKLVLMLKSGNTRGLDIKKLKNRHDIYRARMGDIRIIYRQINKVILILAIERRNENTYKIF